VIEDINCEHYILGNPKTARELADNKKKKKKRKR